MPDNSVQITNLNDGDSISDSFTLSIEYYAEGTGSSASIMVNTPNGNQTNWPIPGLQCGQVLVVTQAIAYTGKTTDTITATLSYNDIDLASDPVPNVKVGGNGVTIGGDGFWEWAAPGGGKAPPDKPIGGTYDPHLGSQVLVTIEAHGQCEKRRQIVYVKEATYPSAGKWSHPAVGHKGSCLAVLLLDANGNVTASTRALID
jgi:hypothetical protein